MPSHQEILIYGAGSNGRVILDTLERVNSSLRMAGFVDDSLSCREVLGYPVFPSLAEPLSKDIRSGIVAIGDNWTRSRVVERILEKAPDFKFISAIHPSAQIGRDVEIGPGTAVMAGVNINLNTRIGSHCILNTSASIEHDNDLEDFSSVGPGAVLGGNVRVGRFSAISLGAKLMNDLDIGPYSIIGAGSMVTRNIPDHVIAYGTPCRIVRPRLEDETYLETRRGRRAHMSRNNSASDLPGASR